MKTITKIKYLSGLAVFLLMGCLPALTGAQDGRDLPARPPFDSAGYRYSLSLHSSFQGKLDEAITELEKALSLDRKSTFLATELATLYMEKGLIEKAIALCEKTIAENDPDIDTHLLLATLYLNRKNHEGALREYLKAAELDPRNINAHLYAGVLYGEMKDYEKALSSFRTVLSLDPENLMANYYLARTLLETKKIDAAEEMYKKTLAIKPAFEQAALDLGQLYEQREEEQAKALELYRQVIKLNPHSVNVRLKLASLLLKLKQPAEAEEVLQETLKANKGNPEVRYTLGLFYMESDQFDKAVEIFSSLLKKNPQDYRLRFLIASAYEEKKEYETAIGELKKIPLDNELYANAQVGISMILKKQGQLDEAIANLDAARQNKQEAVDFYPVLATLYEEKKDLLKAEEILKTGLQVLPKNVALHYSLGVLYEKTSRVEAGINEMKKVLQLDAHHADAMNFIGYSYADRGINLEEAEALIKRALALKPGNGYMLDSLGWVYFRQNKLAAALTSLQEAITLMPEDPTIAEHLGDVYAALGQKDEARKAYERSLKLNPDNKTLREKLEKLLGH